MGFGAELDGPRGAAFLAEMLAEMDRPSGGEAADGQVGRDEFLKWYLQKGAYFLEKPTFQSQELEVPPMARRKELFKQMDDDRSGELSFAEVDGAVRQLWPQITAAEITRAFQIADEDSSGLLSELEFQMMVGFIVYFNANRHTLEELRAQVPSPRGIAGERQIDIVYL